MKNLYLFVLLISAYSTISTSYSHHTPKQQELESILELQSMLANDALLQVHESILELHIMLAKNALLDFSGFHYNDINPHTLQYLPLPAKNLFFSIRAHTQPNLQPIYLNYDPQQ